MSKVTPNQLRALAAKSKATPVSLRDLDKAVLDDIEARLQSGESCDRIAAVMQEEHGVCLNQTLDGLKKALQRYRKGPLREKLLAQAVEANHDVPTADVAKRVHSMLRLEALIEIQTARFDKGRLTEANMPLPMKSVSEEAKILGGMLFKLGHLQLATGFLPRAPKHVQGSVSDPITGSVRDFAWTEVQEQLLEELQAEMAADA